MLSFVDRSLTEIWRRLKACPRAIRDLSTIFVSIKEETSCVPCIIRPRVKWLSKGNTTHFIDISWLIFAASLDSITPRTEDLLMVLFSRNFLSDAGKEPFDNS